MLWREGEPAAVAASHPSLPELIDVQVRRGRGPVLDALSTSEPAGCPDTLDEARRVLGMARPRWDCCEDSRRIRIDKITFVKGTGERWMDLAENPLGQTEGK